MNLMQIGELVAKFSFDYFEATKREMDWRAIKNMRNMFAHDYLSMDIDQIWHMVITDIPTLKLFCQQELEESEMEK